MASTAHTTRRHLFAIAAGASLLPALPAMSASDNGASLLHLEREIQDITVRANNRALSDDETNDLIDQIVEREVQIAEAPCDSLDAFRVKLRTIVHTSLTVGSMYAVDYDALLSGMISFVEGRH